MSHIKPLPIFFLGAILCDNGEKMLPTEVVCNAKFDCDDRTDEFPARDCGLYMKSNA